MGILNLQETSSRLSEEEVKLRKHIEQLQAEIGEKQNATTQLQSDCQQRDNKILEQGSKIQQLQSEIEEKHNATVQLQNDCQQRDNEILEQGSKIVIFEQNIKDLGSKLEEMQIEDSKKSKSLI